MQRPPRFLYFDLGNVLLNFDHEIACRQIGELAGIRADDARAAVFDGDLQWQYECGKLSSREFYERFCERTRSRVDFDALLHAASAIFELNSPVVPIVAHLRSAGHRLGILSNTCDAHWQYIQRHGYWIVNSAFERHALSFQIGEMKPNLRIYESAAKLAGIEPADIFFVDDREENVAAAIEAGYDAVLYQTAAKLADDLRRRGVRFNL